MFVYKVPVLIIFCIANKVLSQDDFGYDGEKGPDHWQDKYATCVGKHQSPINIDDHNVKEIEYEPLRFHRSDEPLNAKLTNNGHTAMIRFEGDVVPSLTGGPLKDEYKFAQMHFHWGDNDTIGSENKINNLSYPMELHIVFYKDTYGGFNEALTHSDGLTVLAFLYELSEEDNIEYKDVIDILPYVRSENTSMLLSRPVILDMLIDSNKEEYYTYEGSLTTPPCSEVVQWIEFKDRIKMSHNQIEVFRSMYGHGGKMSHNFRPVQPTNDRIVYHVKKHDPKNESNVEATCFSIFALLAIYFLQNSLGFYIFY